MISKKEWAGIIALLLVFTLLGLSTLKDMSMTVDETVYIPVGYSYYTTGDFTMNPEHPPLAKYIVAFPALFIQPNLEYASQEWTLKAQFDFAEEFWFSWENDVDRLLFWGRFMILLMGILLGFYVYLFAKELYGIKAGFAALFLYIFSPNIIAHATLATTDIAATVLMFIAIYHFYKFVQKSTIRNLIISGITLGLAFLAKFTAIYLGIAFAIILFIKLRGDQKKLVTSGFMLAGIGGIALFMIITGYLFNFNALFHGFMRVVTHSSDGHVAFLLGMHSTAGWWYYFPIAFLVKTPIPTLILLTLSLIYFPKIKHKSAEPFLYVPILVIFIAFIFNNINIGLRHILPIYPLLFVFVSKTVNVQWPKILKRSVFIILAIWYIAAAMFIHPHHLSYFNEAAGGPANGHNILVDSNIDWGQDLIRLKQYVDEKNIDEEIYVAYFGSDQPDYRGINAKEVQCFPQPGYYAMSVSWLQGLTELQAECTSWIRDNYEPIDRIGYSILFYDLNNVTSADPERDFCVSRCEQACVANGLEFHDVFYENGNCECDCAAPSS